jgi:general secretion pathway protein K
MTTFRRRQGPERHQRGVALLIALVLMALVTIIIYDVWFSGAMEQRRTFAVLSLERGLQYGIGAESFVAKILQDDAANSQQDTPAEGWAQHLPPYEVDGGQIDGSVEDMQGRFNLNNLADPATGGVNQDAVDQFSRLLQLVGLETKWAGLAADWVDADLNPGFPDGAEDSVYTTQTPPYLPPNGPITSTSELLALPGFGIERFHRLEPFVAALPIGTTVNLCTAPGEVLDSFGVGFRQFSLDPVQLANARTAKCFPATADFQAALPPTDWARIQAKSNKGISESSHYFRMTATVTIGTAQFTLYSLLYRDTAQVRPILRSWGSN